MNQEHDLSAKTVTWAMAFIVAAALALRVVGLTGDLPHYRHTDEWYVVQPAYNMGSLDLNPHVFDQPATLQMYLTFALFVGYFAVGRLLGWFDSLTQFKDLYWSDPSSFYLLGRLLVVGFALATVVMVYRLGSRLGGRRHGLVAAAVLALTPLHVMLSRWAMKDVPLAFFVVLTLWFCDRIAQQGRLRDYVWAGLSVGLGVAVKYSAAVLVAPVAVAHAVHLRGQAHAWPDVFRRLLRSREGWIAAASALAAFVLACPYAVLAFDEFARGFRFQMEHQGQGHLGYEPVGNPVWFYLSQRLTPGVTLPIAIAALAGLVLDVHRRAWRAAPMLAFVAVYTAVVSASKVSFARYALPHLPLVAIYAGLAVVSLAQGLAARLGRSIPAQVAAWTVVAAAVAGLLLVEAASQAASNAQPDSRVLAERWIARHVPPEAGWITDSQGPRVPKPLFLVEEGKPLPLEQVVAACRRGELVWAVVNEYTAATMLDPEVARRYPERTSGYQRFIQWLRQVGRPVVTFGGAKAGGRGPRVDIYGLQPSPPPLACATRPVEEGP